MPTVTANWNAKGVIISGLPGGPSYPLTNWFSTRQVQDGLAYQTSFMSDPQIGQVVLSGRGSNSYRIGRVFGWVDVSAYAPNITGIDLNIPWGTNTGINDFIVCESFAFGGATSTTLSGPDMAIGTSWDVNVAYSTNYTYTQNTIQNIALNSTAVAAANASGVYLNFIIIDFDYDYQNFDPAFGGVPASYYGDFNYSLNATADITYNLPGYGNDVNNVASADIDQINGVDTADIDQVNGI